jgi:hypothetical protein
VVLLLPLLPLLAAWNAERFTAVWSSCHLLLLLLLLRRRLRLLVAQITALLLLQLWLR